MREAADVLDGEVHRVGELGSGPGVGLAELLDQFANAQVWGIDLSPVMLAQARKRNRLAVATGRLTLVEGDTSALSAGEPADLVMANHVSVFWHEPQAEMARIRGFLRPGGDPRGWLSAQAGACLRWRRGSSRRQDIMLYDSTDDVTHLATAAGYRAVSQRVKGSQDAPEGRVMLATA